MLAQRHARRESIEGSSEDSSSYTHTQLLLLLSLWTTAVQVLGPPGLRPLQRCPRTTPSVLCRVVSDVEPARWGNKSYPATFCPMCSRLQLNSTIDVSINRPHLPAVLEERHKNHNDEAGRPYDVS